MYFSLLKLILAISFLFVVPGYFFQLAIFGWKDSFGEEKISFFEKAVLSVPFSLILIDLIVLFLNRMRISINGPILFGSVLVLCFLLFAFFQYRMKNQKKENKNAGERSSLFEFSSCQTIFILLAVFLAVFIRVAYLSDTIVPSATDMGHHMYWVQTIVDSGQLPDYGMPDFIIGEHIIFAAVNLISGVGIMTAMPTLLLLFFNIVGIFTIAVLVGHVFKSNRIATISFFMSGALFAINPPQGKYVSGGVIGNVIGDMLIPVAMYFLYRALSEKDRIFAGMFFFSFAGILYTHHLSSLIFIFSAAAFILLYLILNISNFFRVIQEWIKMFLRPFPILVLFFLVSFFLFIFTPSYFNPEAVGQATGEPTKATRVGLNLSQLENSVGSAQLIFGSLGFLLLLFELFKKRDRFVRSESSFGTKYSLAIGWFLILFLLSWKPGWLYVNIPSDRISNYLYLPLALLSPFALVWYFENLRSSASKFFSTVFLFTLLFFVITNGLSDSADVFKKENSFQEAVQTFHSARYLSSTVDMEKDVILKDHVNIYADSWYKLFFMKDYKYPLSRGVLSRYIDPTKPRETCTRDMISDPESEIGKACFAETGVNYIAINSQIEGNSFEKYASFSKIYMSDYISIFRRN